MPGMNFVTVLGDVQRTLGGIANELNRIKASMLGAVEAFRPFQVELFTRSLRDLNAVFGQMFLPVLIQVTAVVRKISDFFYSLPQALKGVITFGGKFSVVGGMLVGAFVLILAALTPILIVGAKVALIVAAVVAGLALWIGAFISVVYMLSQTTGGAKFLRNVLQTVQSAFVLLITKLQAAWASLAPLREAFARAFSALGDALNDLWNAAKPLIGMGIAIVVAGIVVALKIFISILTMVVKVITFAASALAKIVGFFTGGKASRFNIPDLTGPPKSSFGLGLHGGSITSDVAGMKTKIEEAILANVGREDPQIKTAENTGAMKGSLERIDKNIEKLSSQQPAQSKVPRAVFGP